MVVSAEVVLLNVVLPAPTSPRGAAAKQLFSAAHQDPLPCKHPWSSWGNCQTQSHKSGAAQDVLLCAGDPGGWDVMQSSCLKVAKQLSSLSRLWAEVGGLHWRCKMKAQTTRPGALHTQGSRFLPGLAAAVAQGGGAVALPAVDRIQQRSSRSSFQSPWKLEMLPLAERSPRH